MSTFSKGLLTVMSGAKKPKDVLSEVHGVHELTDGFVCVSVGSCSSIHCLRLELTPCPFLLDETPLVIAVTLTNLNEVLFLSKGQDGDTGHLLKLGFTYHGSKAHGGNGVSSVV